MSEILTNEVNDKGRPNFGVTAVGSSFSAADVERILKQRAALLSQAPPSEEKTDSAAQLVAFYLGEELYGLDIAFVREIQPLRDLTLIPCTPDFVIGAVNIRGNIVTVIDIGKLFGLSDRSGYESSKVIVIQGDDLELGIIASQVTEVLSISNSEIGRPLATLTSKTEECIKGEYLHGDKLMLVLDVEQGLMRNWTIAESA